MPTIMKRESALIAEVKGFWEAEVAEGVGEGIWGEGCGAVIEPKAYTLLSSEPT
jgi:hypothetical protein